MESAKTSCNNEFPACSHLLFLEKLSDRYFYLMIFNALASAISLGIVTKSILVGGFVMFTIMSIHASIYLVCIHVRILITKNCP